MIKAALQRYLGSRRAIFSAVLLWGATASAQPPVKSAAQPVNQPVNQPVAQSVAAKVELSPPLRELLRRFRAMPGLSANFVEEKTMTLLAMPLISRGEVHFYQGGGERALVRHTLEPTTSSLLLQGDLLRLGDASDFQVIDLKSQPVVRLFVDSFVEIFAGDEAALQRLFLVEFSGSPASWTLRLVPRAAAVVQVIARIDMIGHESVVETMTLTEANGDVTVTRFSQVQVGRAFTPVQKSELFRLVPRRLPEQPRPSSPAPVRGKGD